MVRYSTYPTNMERQYCQVCIVIFIRFKSYAYRLTSTDLRRNINVHQPALYKTMSIGYLSSTQSYVFDFFSIAFIWTRYLVHSRVHLMFEQANPKRLMSRRCTTKLVSCQDYGTRMLLEIAHQIKGFRIQNPASSYKRVYVPGDAISTEGSDENFWGQHPLSTNYASENGSRCTTATFCV